MEKIKNILIELIIAISIFSIIIIADLVDIQIKNSSSNFKIVQSAKNDINMGRKNVYELGDNMIELNNKLTVVYDNKLKDHTQKVKNIIR
ncbi:hypothetical protein [Clostridium tyrobutyricum]|uniref:hypothetical protein n=1 Tax=Clostridium tyrobutyricum TaxID=1519 RepID=UPI00073D1D15|nr:hypothetical protein [Clostridium tyrobutyricum]MBV4417031.1 hypothetical protein [Clostridium tyrobutyricum]MBV4422469.1 hypothetical protein [Clostridium tyrobutyricum]MBV4441539.1 hypothetical protein [Clostridium tyrobutyricum]